MTRKLKKKNGMLARPFCLKLNWVDKFDVPE